MALALGKYNFSCDVIGLTFINSACRQTTGTPKFRGSGCLFSQSQCHPSPRTGIALGKRLAICRSPGSEKFLPVLATGNLSILFNFLEKYLRAAA